MKRLLWLLLVPMMAQAQPRTQVVPRAPEMLIPSAAGVTTTAGEYYAAGAPSRVTAIAIAGTWSGVTVEVFGRDTPCPASCVAADGISLGTITTDGGILDINTGGTVYTYTFALVTIHGSGTVRAEITPLNIQLSASGASFGLGESVNVRNYGAIAGDSVDDLAALTAAETATPANGTIVVPAGEYTLTNTWLLPANKSVWCAPGVRFVSSGFTDAPIIHVLNTTHSNPSYQYGVYGGCSVAGTAGEGNTDADYVGVRLEGVTEGEYEFGSIINTAIGLQLIATDNNSFSDAVQANNIRAFFLRDYTVTAVEIAVDATGVDAYLVSNNIHVGELKGLDDSDDSTLDLASVRVRRLNTPTDDNISRNVIKVDLSQEPNSNSTRAVQLLAGTDNRFEFGHIENTETVLDVVATQGRTINNVVSMRYGVSTSGAAIASMPTSDPGNEYFGNEVVSAQTEPMAGSVWASGDLAGQMYQYNGSNQIRIPGLFGMTSSGAEAISIREHWTPRIVDGLEIGRYMSRTNHGACRYFDTRDHKNLQVAYTIGQGASASDPRMVIGAWESDGTQVTPGATAADAWMMSSDDISTTTAWGDGWLMGNPPSQLLPVTVSGDVAYIRICLTGSGYKSFTVAPHTATMIREPMNSWNPFGDQKSVSGVPDERGSYNLGDVFADIDGDDLYVVTEAGTLATPWASSTGYAEGELVLNDTDNIYVLRSVTCTSAGAGGPTGTGTSITDNDCSWDYYSEQAEFQVFDDGA